MFGRLAEEDTVVAIFSFGAFVHHVGDSDFEYLPIEKRKEFIGYIAILIVVSIVVSIIYVIWMRSNILEKALKLDQEAFTPSDFCLMGSCMTFDDYTPEKIQEAITESF
jgi:hypothetical protein